MAVDTYALTSLANLKAHMGITATTDDTLLERIIDRVSARAESIMGRRILSRSYAEWRTGSGGALLTLRNRPVISMQSVLGGESLALSISLTSSSDVSGTASVHAEGSLPALVLRRTNSSGTTSTTSLDFASYPTIALLATAISAVSGFSATASAVGRSAQLLPIGGKSLKQSTGYFAAAVDEIDARLDANAGTLRLASGAFPRRPQIVLIEYTAGYASIPYGIEEAVIDAAAQVFHGRKRDQSTKSESLGDYSYSMAGASELRDILTAKLQEWTAIR